MKTWEPGYGERIAISTIKQNPLQFLESFPYTPHKALIHPSPTTHLQTRKAFCYSTTHWSSLFLSVTQSPATSRQNCHWLQSYQIKASGHLSEQLLSATKFWKSLLDIILLYPLPASHCTFPRCSESGGWFAPVHSDLLLGFSGFTAEELLFVIPSVQFTHPPPSRKT